MGLMNQKDKLLKRFYGLPKDFTFEEMTILFSSYGFHKENKGATSGSRVIFVNDEDGNRYIMHKDCCDVHASRLFVFSARNVHKSLEITK